jgi:hypothetical protein
MTDYKILEQAGKLYITKKLKGGGGLSKDRQEITESQMMEIAHHFLLNYCEEHNTDHVTIVKYGVEKFKMELLDKSDLE